MLEKFIEENLERDSKEFTPKNEIYERYTKFCEFNNIEPLNKNGLTRYLNDHLIGVSHRLMLKRKIINGRWGVKLKSCQY